MFDCIYWAGQFVDRFGECCVEIVDDNSGASNFTYLNLIAIQRCYPGAVSQDGDQLGGGAGFKMPVVGPGA